MYHRGQPRAAGPFRQPRARRPPGRDAAARAVQRRRQGVRRGQPASSSSRPRTRRAGPTARSRAACRGSRGSPRRTGWSSPTTTATACSAASATSGSIRRSGCCSCASATSPAGCASTARARVVFDDPAMADFPGAQMLISVTPTDIFPNCPRYIPHLELVEPSIYAPRPETRAGRAGLEGLRRLQGRRPAAPRAASSARSIRSRTWCRLSAIAWHFSRISSVASSRSGTITVIMPAAWAARTPLWESSSARQPLRRARRALAAAVRNGSGWACRADSRRRPTMASNHGRTPLGPSVRCTAAMAGRGGDGARESRRVQVIEQFDDAGLQRHADLAGGPAPADTSAEQRLERKIVAEVGARHGVAGRRSAADHAGETPRAAVGAARQRP